MKTKKRRWINILKTSIISVFSLVLLGFLSLIGAMVISRYRPAMQPIVYEVSKLDAFPTQAWQRSTPEEQGMDSAKLLEMVSFYEEKHTENKTIVIDSITIIRNGTMVADIYLNSLYPTDTKHIIHSCTKSIMSALVGIAIDKGYIDSVDVPVIDILNDKNVDNDDPRIKSFTLKDVLTMQTGLYAQDDRNADYWQLFEMQKLQDWTEFILNLPFEVDPGKRFDYSNMASFLLSAIVKKSTGMDTLEFAQLHLFDALGITDVQWEKSPQGIDIGWARMWLKPHDMAKIGLLYLQKGQWEGQQIISSDWIDDSLTAHSQPKKYRYIFNKDNKVDYTVSGSTWAATNLVRPFADGYGYQWWLDKDGMYSAMGVGGQYITVVPEENLVMVVTSKLSGIDVFLPVSLLDKYILPAIQADDAIAANETAQAQLVLLSKPPEFVSDPKPVDALPDIAQDISELTYSLEPNPFKYDNFRLVFDSNNDYAEFSYTAKEADVVNYHIGLDNTFHLTDSSGGSFAAIGSWTTPTTFVIDYEQIGYSTQGQWVLTFKNEAIEVEEVGVVGTHHYTGQSKHSDY